MAPSELVRLLGDARELPAPVVGYLQRALLDAPSRITSVRLLQRGELRTSIRSERWLPFSAIERVTPLEPAFSWEARVSLPMGLRLRVVDSYAAAIGEGRVSLLGLPLARERNRIELNEGALHRFLAESPWYPTVLVPSTSLTWAPIDDRAALATLKDRNLSVSLEFRFDAAGDVCGVFSAGRWGRFDSVYQRVPWEGHFSRHAVNGGLRVPEFGEVGWYDGEHWRPVWRGSIAEATYRFES